MAKTILLVILFLSIIVYSNAAADQIVGWRTDWTGRYPDTNPVIEWSTETNVIWKTPMPNWGNASPVVVGDRIFVCAEPTTLICVRASDGEILWQRTNTYLDMVNPGELNKVKKLLEEIDVDGTAKKMISAEKKRDKARNELKKLTDDAEPEKRTELEQSIADFSKEAEELKAKLEPVEQYVTPLTRDVNGYSSPTPVSDGKNVYVFFGTGVAACYDMDGNRKWIKLVEKPTDPWGHSSSPVLVGDKLIIYVRSVTALDKDTGAVLWNGKSKARWGTPIHTNIGGVDVVITPNGEFFRASDGKLLAKDTGLLEYATPIIHDGIVYFVQHGGKAFRLPSEVGETLELDFLWETKPKDDRYYSSALYHEGLLYGIVRRGPFFSVIDAKTGEVIYEEKLKLGKGEAYSSITLAGKYMLLGTDDGTTVVMEPGRVPKEIARNTLETFRTTPVFVGDRMYIRGMENLYCIGK